MTSVSYEMKRFVPVAIACSHVTCVCSMVARLNRLLFYWSDCFLKERGKGRRRKKDKEELKKQQLLARQFLIFRELVIV